VSQDPLAQLRPDVQAELDAFLERQHDLLASISSDLEPLIASARTLLRAGKRLRPAFLYWSARAAEREPLEHAVLVRTGAALELFQAAALVHDDLIDASETRRGAPAAHRTFAAMHRTDGWQGDPDSFGAASAVLLGDLLLGWSDELFLASGLETDTLMRTRRIFDTMRTEVGAGQYLDVLEQASADSRPYDRVERAHRVLRYKSARYSVQRPMQLGAALADASEALRTGLGQAGELAGEAFQLRDDVLGVFGDPEATGKPAGDDLREGKRTVLVAHALERAGPRQERLLREGLGEPSLSAADVERLREVMVETSALATVEDLVTDLGNRAVKILDGLELDEVGRRVLYDLVAAAAHRRM